MNGNKRSRRWRTWVIAGGVLAIAAGGAAWWRARRQRSLAMLSRPDAARLEVSRWGPLLGEGYDLILAREAGVASVTVQPPGEPRTHRRRADAASGTAYRIELTTERFDQIWGTLVRAGLFTLRDRPSPRGFEILGAWWEVSARAQIGGSPYANHFQVAPAIRSSSHTALLDAVDALASEALAGTPVPPEEGSGKAARDPGTAPHLPPAPGPSREGKPGAATPAERLLGAIESGKHDSATLESFRHSLGEETIEARVRLCERAVKADPASAELQVMLSFAYMDAGAFQLAAGAAHAALALEPDNQTANELMVRSLEAAGQRRAAEEAFATALSRGAVSSTLGRAMIARWLSAGRKDQASKAAADLVAKEPSASWAHELRAQVLLANDEAQAAVRECARAESLSPGLGSIAAVRGWALYQQGKYREAYQLFRGAAARQTMRAALLGKSACDARLGRPEQALDGVRTVVAIETRGGRWLTYIEPVYPDGDAMWNALRRAGEAGGDGVAAQSLAGVAAAMAKQPDQAWKHFERVIKQDPTSEPARGWLRDATFEAWLPQRGDGRRRH
jgi:Tfp pilus assembly protein PilF